MKNKILYILIGVLALALGFISGHYTQAKSGLQEEDFYLQVIESARQEGYSQCYIEIKYGMGLNISEDDFSKYLDTKQKYENHNTLENYKELVEVTQMLLKADQ